MVWGKWLMDQMWDRYIIKNHHISDSSLVDAIMLNHAVPYDPTLRHVDLDVKVNCEGVYHYFGTGNNTSTLHCYQVHKKGEARNDHKAKTGFFCISASIISLPIILTWKRSFKAVMTKVIPNMIGPQTPTSKKAVMMVMGKWPSLM